MHGLPCTRGQACCTGCLAPLPTAGARAGIHAVHSGQVQCSLPAPALPVTPPPVQIGVNVTMGKQTFVPGPAPATAKQAMTLLKRAFKWNNYFVQVSG